MKICVFGLQHLGCVTAACLADKGFVITGLDPNIENVEFLNRGISPIFEPNLNELIYRNLGINLKFTTDIKSALKDTKITWVTFDTPVDGNDIANTLYVKHQIFSLYPHLSPDTVILISSQLPVGSTRKLQEEHTRWFKNYVTFAYSPENLRHGKAIEIFNNPERIIVGTNTKNNVNILDKLFKTINPNIIWMSLESAEMTKHALNAFLATQITFINEISLICKETGADVEDVEKGLKSDSRIGKKAFLKAGKHYSGGTLGRDVQYLREISDDLNLKSTLLKSISESNNNHKKLVEKL
jgi:UDPglucose 6-dehydrogenase